MPGVQAPHDMAVIAAPVRLAGKERPIALLIGETRPSGSRLQKYIVLPEGVPPLLFSLTTQVNARRSCLQWSRVNHIQYNHPLVVGPGRGRTLNHNP